MNEEEQGGKMNPWRMILSKPRVTLRWLLANRPGYGVPLLTVLQGIAITFQQVSNEELMRLVNFPVFVMMAVVTGPLWGAVAVYGGSYIMKWTGRVFGGVANVMQLRMALAWASLPSLFQLLIVFGVLLRFGVTGAAIEPLAALQTGAISVAIGLWQLVLLIACLMEVQEYAFSKALGNIVLFTLVMFFVLLLPLILLGILLVS
ncbi:Yip1 family protein [Azotosporobacter soli]|uniref:Yip1 family protein n=1 Tax=Azotosporobacter soli TaxID=3055040 RepID=UPI0031FEF3C7